MEGFAPGSGFAPNVYGPEAIRRAQPDHLSHCCSEAKPRLTSGGRAVKRVPLGQSCDA